MIAERSTTPNSLPQGVEVENHIMGIHVNAIPLKVGILLPQRVNKTPLLRLACCLPIWGGGGMLS